MENRNGQLKLKAMRVEFKLVHLVEKSEARWSGKKKLNLPSPLPSSIFEARNDGTTSNFKLPPLQLRADGHKN